MRVTQGQKSKEEIWLSSNGKPSARCPAHPDLPVPANPVFACESCGREYCPACAGRVWFECQVGRWHVRWYRCPGCPIGLGFIMFPEGTDLPTGPVQDGGAADQRGADRNVRPSVSPVVVRQGSYEALPDGSGICQLVLDGREQYAWLQGRHAWLLRANDVHPQSTGAALYPLQRGEYMVIDRPAGPGDQGGPALYLEFPHGYQEYTLPAGWPEGEQAKPLQVSPWALSRQELNQLLRQEPLCVPAKQPENRRSGSEVAYALAA